MAKTSSRIEAKELADLVEEAIDEGATTVEEIHKAIADLPLEVLERLDLFGETVEDVRKVQKASIGAVYDVIRRINREVAGLAEEILETPSRVTGHTKASSAARGGSKRTKRSSARSS